MSINLYNFRGFKTYQKELPAIPDTPLHDIAFFVGGVWDSATELLRCDYYGGYDWIIDSTDDGEWPYYFGKPEDYATETAIEIPTAAGSLVRFPCFIPYADGLRIALRYDLTDGVSNGTTNVTITFEGHASPVYINIVESTSNRYSASIQRGATNISITDTTASGTFSNAELAFPTSDRYVDVYRAGEYYDGAAVALDYDITGIRIERSGGTCLVHVKSIMISTDPTINFYTTTYNSTPIYQLTTVPRLAIPSITDHPDNATIVEGGSANVTVAANSNGGTLTYQWSYDDGGGYDEIEGAESATYAASLAGSYRCAVTNEAGTVNSNAATLTVQVLAYSQTATISHASEPTDQQVMFTINRSSGSSSGTTIYVDTDCEADYADVRFYCDDVLLDYWIEPEYTSSTANIWVKFPEIFDHNLDLVVKYGNSEVASASSAEDTFIAYRGAETTAFVDTVFSSDAICRYKARVRPTSTVHTIDWMMRDADNSEQVLIQSDSASGNMIMYTANGAYGAISEAPSMTNGTWYTIEATLSSTEAHGYVDGNEIATGRTANLPTSALTLSMGFEIGTGEQAWSILAKYLATAPTIGSWSSEVAGDILFGTHFDDESDWNTSQDADLLTDWDQKSADNEGGGTYEAGYIAQHGESSGKCLKQYWDTGTSVAQNCWLIKNSITIPDEFWLGYRFKVDTNWDWGSATSLKIMKLHYDNGTTLDINWCSSHYEMPSPYTPPGGGYSIATDATGKNWFGHWTDIDDGAWHTFVWHFKHSTNTLECFIDGTDGALTSETPAFPGTGWDDGSESGYALSFGGNLSGGGGGVDEMYTKYDDICIGTTRAKVEEYLGL